MRRRDIAEEMVSIKGREWRVTLRALCLCENNSKWWSLQQSLSSAFIASKSWKHSDWWQNMCSVYKTSHKWLRFHSLAVCFFWLLSGCCWNNDRKPASLGKISSLRTIILLLSSVRESTLHISLMSVWAKWLFSFKYHSHYISSTYPLDQLLFWFSVFWDLRQWVVSAHLP